jgi:hypothetical protein
MRGKPIFFALCILLFGLHGISAQEDAVTPKQILFHDDFEDGDLQGWNLTQAQDAVSVSEIDGNHVLHISGEQNDYVVLGFRGTGTRGAQVLEARVMFVQDSRSRDRVLNFNLLGNSDGWKGYSALVSPRPAGAFFADRADEGFVGLESSYSSAFQIQYGEWGLMRLAINGDLLTLLINGVMVAQTYIDPNRNGVPSFVIGPRMELYLDDVYVLSDDVGTANTEELRAALPEYSSLSPQDVLFYDDFEDGDLRGWDNSQRRGTVIQEPDGNHVLRLTSTDWAGISIGDQTWTDYAVEARIKITANTDAQSPSAFFSIRDTGSGENYSAYLSANFNASGGIGLNSGGEWTGLPISYVAPRTLGVRQDFWHVFRFQVFGNRLQVFFDNQLVSEYTDNQIISGRVTFAVAPNAEFYLDDVYILSADVPTGLQPQPLPPFVFDNTAAACDFTALPVPPSEILTGTVVRGVNVRSAPKTDAAIITYVDVGEIVTFTDQAPLGERVTLPVSYTSMGETLNSLTSHQWLGVEVERNGEIRSGYIWRFAVQADPPSQPFTNPYDACIPQVDTAGWREALQAAIGENWSNFISAGSCYYYPCANSIHLVLDGVWITQPIPFYDGEGELLGISLLSMRGYYLDARGDLQSLILPYYVQTNADEVREPYLSNETRTLGEVMPFITSAAQGTLSLQRYQRGEVVTVGLTEDSEAMINYRGRNNFNAVSLETIALHDRYQQSILDEIARLLFAGDPSVGFIWSNSMPWGSSLSGIIELPNNE